MSLSSDVFRKKLIEKIPAASTLDEVNRFINAAMKGLEKHRTDSHIIQQCTEKAAAELALYNPFDTRVQEWSNSKRAIVILYRISTRMKQPVH